VEAAAGVEDLAGDPAAVVGGEEGDDVGDVLARPRRLRAVWPVMNSSVPGASKTATFTSVLVAPGARRR